MSASRPSAHTAHFSVQAGKVSDSLSRLDIYFPSDMRSV